MRDLNQNKRNILGEIKMDRAVILEEPQNCIDYEREYARLYEENINLKIENETLKETIVKLAVRM